MCAALHTITTMTSTPILTNNTAGPSTMRNLQQVTGHAYVTFLLQFLLVVCRVEFVAVTTVTSLTWWLTPESHHLDSHPTWAPHHHCQLPQQHSSSVSLAPSSSRHLSITINSKLQCPIMTHVSVSHNVDWVLDDPSSAVSTSNNSHLTVKIITAMYK